MSFRNEPVPLDCFEGQQWSVLFNLNAAAAIERSTGQNPLGWTVMEWGQVIAKPSMLLPVLASCMGHLKKPPTEKLLGEVWRPDHSDPVFYALMRSVKRYIGKQAESEIDAELSELRKTVDELVEQLSGEPAKPEAGPLPLQ